MSALAQQQSIFVHYHRRLSEVELLRAVSNQTWNAADEETALTAIAAAILRVSGLSGFRFEPWADLSQLPIHETTKPGKDALRASAVSPVAANGLSWGQVRIFFDPHLTQTLESPVRVTKFLGQQIGILFHRLALKRERQKHKAHLQALDRITRRRKIINRAAAILAEQRAVSERDAVALMVVYARRSRQNLLTIAESLIFGYNNLAFSRPSLRRAAVSAH